MSQPEAAAEYYLSQQRLRLETALAVQAAWKLMTPNFDVSWARIVARLLRVVTAAQLRAAQAAASYIPDVLDELGTPAPATAVLQPVALAGVASDGRPLDSLLYGAVTRAKQVSKTELIEGEDGRMLTTPGLTPRDALQSGGRWLDMATVSQLADTGRAASQAEIVIRPKVTGYVRMLNPPSCSRCVVLAGKWYRWNAGFQRHPRCDCRHIPAAENAAGDLTTNPTVYFDTLTAAEQNRIFTTSGAQAIRDGADVGQVVNARSGMAPAQLNGSDVLVTRVGTTRRGLYGSRAGKRTRLMPESIYKIAADRDDAIRLLTLYGFVT